MPEIIPFNEEPDFSASERTRDLGVPYILGAGEEEPIITAAVNIFDLSEEERKALGL